MSGRGDDNVKQEHIADPTRMRKCQDCGDEFEFTVGEEQFLMKTFGETYSEPKRCTKCRKLNKERKANKAKQHQPSK